MGSLSGKRTPLASIYNAARTANSGSKNSSGTTAAAPVPSPISNNKIGSGTEHTFADGSVAFTTAGGVTIGGAAGSQATAYAATRNGKR